MGAEAARVDQVDPPFVESSILTDEIVTPDDVQAMLWVDPGAQLSPPFGEAMRRPGVTGPEETLT